MRQNPLSCMILLVILSCLQAKPGVTEDLPESLTFLPPSPLRFTQVDTIDSPPAEVKVRAFGSPPGGTFSLSMENPGYTGGTFTLVNDPPGTFTFRGEDYGGGGASVDVTYVTPKGKSIVQTYNISIVGLAVDPDMILTTPSPAAVSLGGFPLIVDIHPGFAPPNFKLSLLSSDPGTTGGSFHILDAAVTGGRRYSFYYGCFTATGTATATFGMDYEDGFTNSFTYVVEVNQKEPFKVSTSGPLSISFGGPEFPDTLTKVITVSGHPPIQHLRVLVDISHTFIGDVGLTLTSPQGISLNLVESSGLAGVDMGVIFDDVRGKRMGIIFDDLMFPGFQTPGNPLPFPYILSQESPGLSVFNGVDPNGDWTLTITDIFPDSDVGILNEWSLDID